MIGPTPRIHAHTDDSSKYDCVGRHRSHARSAGFALHQNRLGHISGLAYRHGEVIAAPLFHEYGRCDSFLAGGKHHVGTGRIALHFQFFVDTTRDCGARA